MPTENLYTPGCIRTVSGQYVNIADPQPETILIEDIAHALSMLPRFGGHLPRFYSVAQHCWRISRGVPEGMELQALLHDASEAYLLDMPSPIKALLPEYRKLEDRLMAVIAKKFGFSWPMESAVKEADRSALEYEWRWIMLQPKENIRPFIMTQEMARVRFLEQFSKFSNSGLKYHVEFDIAFWLERFPEWEHLPAALKQERVHQETARVQDFLLKETPAGQVDLIISSTGTLCIAVEGPVHVTPLVTVTTNANR